MVHPYLKWKKSTAQVTVSQQPPVMGPMVVAVGVGVVVVLVMEGWLRSLPRQQRPKWSLLLKTKVSIVIVMSICCSFALIMAFWSRHTVHIRWHNPPFPSFSHPPLLRSSHPLFLPSLLFLSLLWYSGKVVVLDFSAGWCKNCKKIAPLIR